LLVLVELAQCEARTLCLLLSLHKAVVAQVMDKKMVVLAQVVAQALFHQLQEMVLLIKATVAVTEM
jgi:hypothetical protein